MKLRIARWKTLARNSLRRQLLMRSLLIMAVVLLLLGVLQYLFMSNLIYRNKVTSLQSQVMSLPPDIWQQQESSRIPVNDNGGKRHFFMPETALAMIDTSGKYTPLTNDRKLIAPRLTREQYLAALQRKPGLNYQIVNSGGTQQLLVLQRVGAGPGQTAVLIQASTPTGPLNELLFRQLLIFLCLSLVAMVIGLLCYLSVLNRSLVPLFNMVETAEQIDAGNLARRFPTRQGQQEIDRLAESCNGMLKRLEVSFAAELETKEQMRRFVADASHELRTPLTSIHGFLEVLLRGAAQQPDQLDKSLRCMYNESERLNKLVQELLLLAKLDRRQSLELREGDLGDVLREMVPQLRILAGERHLQLQSEPELRCQFDVNSMKQVILNLFHNAVQQTDPVQGSIRIALCRAREGVELSMADNGPGISSTNLPHIFDRFFRSDSSRTRKYGGAGLGLSITKSIVGLHGGTIEVANNEGAGCTFTVWFPQTTNPIVG